MIIAIDGSAASGKGTLARKLQQHYGFSHLDTGLLYRALAYFLYQKNPILGTITPACLEGFDPHSLPDEDILRSKDISQLASCIAQNPLVREKLLHIQHAFIEENKKKGVILDGRDIGTIVCPEAEIKLFLQADTRERARRRHQEKSHAHQAPERVFEELQKRDKRDEERPYSPSLPAKDAIILDTTNLSIEEVFLHVCAIIDKISSMK